MESRVIRVAIKAGAVLVLAFLYIPLLIVVIYSFNNSVSQTWPISSRSLQTAHPACAADTCASLLFVNGVCTAEIVTLGPYAPPSFLRADRAGR